MDIGERIKAYEEIEAFRGRPLIVYCTSTRSGVGAMMASDAVREFIDQIDAIDGHEAIDVLLHSTGGDALTAWKLMTLLRERFGTVAVLVPFMAFSAATIFALGADQIVMHPHASLGPIDPQITITPPDGKPRLFSFEDVGAFLRFLADEVKITEQAHISAIIGALLSVVDPLHIGGAKRASELSTDVGERLLRMHMTEPEERTKAREIAEALNKSFYAHGDAVSRSRARDLNLKVADDDPVLEALIWKAFRGIEEYMELRSPFNPLHHYLAHGGAAAIAPSVPLKLPQNAPAQIVQQVWNQVAQNAIQALANPSIEVDYSVVNGVIESCRRASEIRTEGALTAARVAGGEIKLAATDRKSSWLPVALPTKNDGEAEVSGSPADAEGIN